jgi:solute carrier family 45 protein 1/2/4
MSDMASESQQSLAQTLASIMSSLGFIIGFLFFSSFDEPTQNIFTLFAVACACFIVTVSISMYFAIEVPRVSAAKDVGSDEKLVRWYQPFLDIRTGLTTMPPAMQRICFVQFVTWLGWSCVLPIITTWVAKVVFEGDSDLDSDSDDPRRKAYDDGVSAAGMIQSYMWIMTLCASLTLPLLGRKIGLKNAYTMSLAITAAGLYGAVFLVENSEWKAGVFIAVCGVGNAASFIFPFAIVGSIFPDPESKGLMMATLNIFIVIPQVMMYLITGTITDETGSEKWVFLLGACWFMCASAAVSTLQIPEALEKGETLQSHSDYRPRSDMSDLIDAEGGAASQGVPLLKK